METTRKHSFFIQNTVFGLFIGATLVLASYIFYRTGQTICLNPQLNNVLLLLSLAGTFVGVRKYREECLAGILSYGKALGTCIYLIAVASLLYGFYIYILYRTHPELQAEYIQMIDLLMVEVYKDSPLVEEMRKILSTFMTTGIIAFSEVFNKIFTGFLFSLLLAGILRRKP